MAESILAFESRADLEPCQVTGETAGLREDEQDLVNGLREGTEEAYEALISRFQQPVYSLVHRLLNDPGDASDVVQEVFLKVFRKIGAFRGQSSLKTWIYRIAVNEAHNHRRWFSRHRRQEVGLDGDEENGRGYGQVLTDAGGSPFDYVLDREKQELVEDALARLSPAFRDAVVLRDIEDLNYEEVAQILQVPLGTVKSRILRGRDALRQELTGRFETHPAMDWRPQPAE